MHNRRKFIIQTSLATAAVAFLKPLKSIAFTSAKVSSADTHKLSILNISSIDNLHNIRLANKHFLTQQNHSLLLVSTANLISTGHHSLNDNLNTSEKLQPVSFDAITTGEAELAKDYHYFTSLVEGSTLQDYNHSDLGNLLPHKSFFKGSIKVGIVTTSKVDISAKGAEREHRQNAKAVTATAMHLKENEGCNLVLFLDNADDKNFRNQTKDTLEFAGLTTDVDVIITSGTSSLHHTYIAHNKKGEEVIVRLTNNIIPSAERLEIGFNSRCEKTNVSFYPIV